MTAGRTYIAVLAGIGCVALLSYVWFLHGLDRRFFIFFILLILTSVTYDDGSKARLLNEGALINHLLLPALILIVLPLVYTRWNLGIKEFLGISAIIFLGIISWTSGFAYRKTTYKRSYIFSIHLIFSLIFSGTLYCILTFYEFSQVLFLTSLIIIPANLLLLYVSPRNNSHPTQESPAIYSQRNWPEEFKQVLAVQLEDPKKRERLPLWEHKVLLRDRYRILAQRAIDAGQNPAQTVKEFLEVNEPADDPDEIADSILASEAFRYVLSSRDDARSTETTNPRTLWLLYDGTSLGQVVRLLREIHLNSLDV